MAVKTAKTESSKQQQKGGSLNAAAAATAAPSAPKRMIGATGTTIYAGYFNEEYHEQLRGHQAYDTYDEMRRSDGQIQMVLRAVKNPIRSASFRHEPKDDSEKSKEIAEFFDWQWTSNPFFDWAQFINEVLTVLEFGHSVIEYFFKTYQHRQHGMVHVLGGMGFRKQKTIERWIVKPGEGLTGIEQVVFGDTVPGGSAANLFIPVDQLLVFVNDQEGDNYEGISLLRGCYGPWFRKNHLLKMNMIGAEKAAVGVPVGKYSNAAQDDERARFEAILGNFAVHETAYLMAPAGFEIEVQKLDFDSEKLLAAIAYEDAQMSRSILFHFLELGQNGNGGSFALGSDLSDMALASIQFIGNAICKKMAAINTKLAEWNFGDPDLAPTPICSGINQKAGVDLANVIKTLVDGRVIQPDNKLEAHVRDTYNLPKADEATIRKAPPPPAPFGDGKPGQKAEPEEDDKEPEEDPPAKEKKFNDVPTWTPRRSLTIYEQPLNFSELVDEGDQTGAQMTQLIKLRLAGMVDYVVRSLDKRLKQGAASRIKVAGRIPIETSDYEKSLLRAMAAAVSLGSRQASRMLAAKNQAAKFADPVRADLEFLPPHVQEVLRAQAKRQAQAHAEEIRKILDFTVQGGEATLIPDRELISNVEDKLGEFVESPRVSGAARTIASQALAHGRDGFFFDPANLPQIQAFQYSSVIDDGTTPICLSLDGKIFKPGDPSGDRLRPPNHHGCRSILVPITVNEPKPALTGLDMDPSNPILIDEYRKRGLTPPDMAAIKRSRNL